MLLSLAGLSMWVALAPQPAAAQGPVRSPGAVLAEPLRRELEEANGPVSFLVILDEQLTPPALVAQAQVAAQSAGTARAAIYQALTAHAARTQAPLRAWLDAQQITYRSFYLVNMLEVEGDLTLAEALRSRPEVDRLVRNPATALTQATVATIWPRWGQFAGQTGEMTAALPYGLTYTHADQVWALGYEGQGVVVGSQDTGVDWDHVALIDAYRGWDAASGTADHVYNWYDAFGRDPVLDPSCPVDPQVPCDDQGHGTHTVGTLLGDATAVGKSVLGMAPEAKWIGCRNMRHGIGTPASYTACFEFLLAPFPQGGDPQTEGRPELGAHVINNSWGCPPSEGCDFDSLRQVVENMRSAGVFVVASAGNHGPGCSTVEDPIGIYDAVFSVGAHNDAGLLAGFSSRGPVTVDGSNRRKPDLTAPGVNVYSTYPNNGYASLSGTSMAAPHVAGAVALLWSAAPDLRGQIDLSEQVLTESTIPAPTFSCGGDGSATPNNLYGAGRLDALHAITLAQQPISLTLVLVDEGGQPLMGLAAALTGLVSGETFTATSVVADVATWAAVTMGSYELTVVDQDNVSCHATVLQDGMTINRTVFITCRGVHVWLPLIWHQ